MNSNIDASAMRRMNRATVLRLVRDLRTTSRIDIAQMTGLNKATVSNIVEELIKEQFIVEMGYGSSSGGRKPILLRFNANAAYAIGVDVQLSHITTVVCNIRGEVVYRETHPLQLHGSAAEQQRLLEGVIESEIQRAIDAAPKSPYGLVGTCIGLPGMVNFRTGTVHYLPGVFQGQWNIAENLSNRFSFPVYCDNDANCGAWSEYQSRRSGRANFAYINVGMGIGTGIVIENKLYRGASGIAGEFGHMTLNPMGSACPCGNYGCWEEYASERSLLRYIREAGGDTSVLSDDRPLMEQVLNEARLDNRAFIRALHSLGQYLGIGIANVLNALNPDEIILGGSVASAATFILPEMERVIHHRAIWGNKRIPIHIANVNSVAIGAACLAIDEVLFSQSSDALTERLL
jgi:N-acetylglucosamine repressor